MRKLTRYFGLLCPESVWDAEAERVFDDLFHPDVRIVGKRTNYNFTEWKKWYQHSIQNNLQVDMEHLQVLKAGQNCIIQWKISIHNPDNNTRVSHTAKGLFQNGQLIQTEPLDPAVYDIMTQKSHPQKRKPVCIL